MNRDFDELAANWEVLGKEAPLEAISTPVCEEKKWSDVDFFKSGVTEISGVMNVLRNCHVSLKTNKALDFGCGAGRLTFALEHFFDEVVGVDVSFTMVDLAKKYNAKYDKKCTFCVNKVPNLKLFKDRTFNFIYSNMTLQHMKPTFIFEYIKEFMRILDNAGILVFQLPHAVEVVSQKSKGVKQIIKRLIPRGVLKMLRGHEASYNDRLTWIKGKMEMHGVEQTEILPLIKSNGGELFNLVKEIDDARPKWESIWYYVKKN